MKVDNTITYLAGSLSHGTEEKRDFSPPLLSVGKAACYARIYVRFIEHKQCGLACLAQKCPPAQLVKHTEHDPGTLCETLAYQKKDTFRATFP